jgi:hypothetical protein
MLTGLKYAALIGAALLLAWECWAMLPIAGS